MKNYTKIPNELFQESQLSVNERYLFGLLLKYSGKKDFCFPSQKTLGGIMLLSERYIRKLLQQLKNKGIIHIQRTGFNKPNTYKVSKNLIRITDISTDRKTKSYHIGTPVPLHTGTIIPPKNTYIRGKENINIKNIEELNEARKKLIKKGFNLQRKSPINYKLISKNDQSSE